MALTNPDQIAVAMRSFVHTNGNYQVILPTLPIALPPSGLLLLKVVFQPVATGYFHDTVDFYESNLNHPLSRLVLTGRGVVVPPAHPNTLYALSASGDSSQLWSVNPDNGQMCTIGPTREGGVFGLRVHPKTHQLLGLAKTVSSNLVPREPPIYERIMSPPQQRKRGSIQTVVKPGSG